MNNENENDIKDPDVDINLYKQIAKIDLILERLDTMELSIFSKVEKILEIHKSEIMRIVNNHLDIVDKNIDDFSENIMKRIRSLEADGEINREDISRNNVKIKNIEDEVQGIKSSRLTKKDINFIKWFLIGFTVVNTTISFVAILKMIQVLSNI